SSSPSQGDSMQTNADTETLRIGKHEFRSRLFVGTGKYPSLEVMQAAHAASGAEVVTVAIRRMHLDDKSGKTLVDYIDRTRMTLLPNTAGCYTAKDAVLTAKLAREALGTRSIPTRARRSLRLKNSCAKDSRCCRTSSTTRSRASGSKRWAAPPSC